MSSTDYEPLPDPFRVSDMERWLSQFRATAGAADLPLAAAMDEYLAEARRHAESGWSLPPSDPRFQAATVGFVQIAREYDARMTAPFVASGRKYSAHGRKGGRPAGTKAARDTQLAEEFAKSVGTMKSETARMAAIGKKAGLKRTRSITVITRALKKPSAKPD